MNIFRNHREKLDKNNPNEMYYETKKLSDLKYIKVIYMGLDNKFHEIKTDVKFIGDSLISLYFNNNQDFNINYPQDIVLKMVTPDAMYIAQAVLHEIKKADKTIWFSVVPPTKMVMRQDRKFNRANIVRPCVLSAYDGVDKGQVYLARSVNLSGSGVLIHKPETMDDDEIIELHPSSIDLYNILLFMDTDIILKLCARYIRTTKHEDSHGYAFQFIQTDKKNTDIICQEVTNELAKQPKSK